MKLLKSRRRLLKSKPKAEVPPAFTSEQVELCTTFFDLEHYRKVSGTASFTKESGLDHYLESGWRQGLDPSMEFSTQGYLDLYPDVAEAGINPLLHYVLHGRFENRHIQRADGGFKGKIESLTRSGVRGWAANEHNPAMIMPLRVMINDQHYATIHNDKARPDLRRHGISEGAGGFQLAIPFGKLEPGTYQVALEFPDGTRLKEALPIGSSASVSQSPVTVALSPERVAALKVVVPIYNAIDDVRVCIARLREHTPRGVEVILINDGSSDPAICEELNGLAGEDMFRVLHNETNLGFTRTINRGIEEAGDADVIILNSDARVTPRWIEGMDAAARSRARVATVTAMSDRAGAFSAPTIGNDNPLPPGVSEEDFATAFRRRSLRLYPEVPTGNGFCMLIRREALDALGGLDADAFPRGYGEENDFCMRALRAGWANLIDDATYVFHDRSKSFGEEKNVNIAKGRAVVDERYPEYKLLTRQYQTGSSIVMARFRARMALADCTNGRGILSRALYVLATRTGGTPQTNADLMGALSDTFECYVLVCDSSTLELSIYDGGESRVLKTHELHEPIEPLTHTSSEYDAIVSAWMGALDLSIVHIRHLGWHSLNLPALARQTGARVIMSFHDYYVLSPSLKLLDDENVFCGPTYTDAGAHRPIEIWPGRSLPTLTDDWIGYWRERMAKALSHCDGFVTTSQSARDRIAEAFPNIPSDHFHVIPHGRDFAEFKNLHHLPDGVSPVRILVPGNINEAKGLDLIAALTDLDRLGIFEFHILGGVRMDGLTPEQSSRLHFHGRYNRADFAKKVAAIAPHFGVVFSVWDETYCHTLTEMWSVGLPVAVLDYPNIRNRVEKSGAGWIFEDLRPDAVYASLVKISSDREDLITKGIAAQRWQNERGRAQSCRQMASRYLDVYAGRAVQKVSPKIAILPRHSSGNSALDQIKADRVLERAQNKAGRPNTYIWSDAAALIAQMRLGMIDGAIVQRDAISAALVDPFLKAAEQTQTPFIMDLDENLLEVPTELDPEGYFKAYAPHLEKLICNSSAVTVPTKALLDRIRGHNSNVILLEDAISGDLWAGGREPSTKLEIRLLYLATGSNKAENELALSILEATRQKIPGLLASVIGANPQMDWPSWIDEVPVPPECRTYGAFVAWLKSEMRTAMMGIAPSLDTPFDAFLSDRRILEYGALGLPVIGSDTASYRTAAQAFPEGVKLVSNCPDVWSQSLATALISPERLANEGGALQSWIFENRSIEGNRSQLDAIVDSILPTKSFELRHDESMNVVTAEYLVGHNATGSTIARERSYPSEPPTFANLDDVSPEWRRVMEARFNRKQGKLPVGQILRVSDVRVFGNGTIVDAEGRMIKETLPNDHITVPNEMAVEVIEDFCVLLRKPGDANFGHWLVELCTRVRDFQRAFPENDWKLAVPGNPLALRPLRSTTLSWLGIDQDRIVWLDVKSRIFKDLAFLTTNSIHSHTHDASAILEFREAALKAVLPVPHSDQPKSRLYVARKPSLRRKLLNEGDVIKICEDNGFTVIYPEDLTIEQQVEAFSSAEIVVGISGAALTNIMFAPKDCKVLSLNPNHGHEFFFWDISTIIGQEFSFLFGQSAQPNELGHADFSIDTEIFSGWLNERI